MVSEKFFSRSLFSLSVTMQQWLFWSSGFSCMLLLARIVVTGSPAYLFLPWNLFLAFVPYGITGRLMQNIAVMESGPKLFFVLAIWLLFIPNSFYIITDLFHLSHIDLAPKWFDLLMIFSFAWNGILYGIISLRRVELIVSLQGGKKFTVPLVFTVMWLSAFGMYIGRFLRFNSWDVITDPFSLAAEITNLILHPLQNGWAWGMTSLYSVFMTVFYFTLKKLAEIFINNR
jgi:uncharacterized membrane protein